ncbi:Flagellar M-ring protein [Fundidesulfovibrio magnetotacticus]|uniref:Flagellar M-ring protein n=1 Tax=Fundidesulfovibrio magnetotacticus TaxID=2730080 RepID=A0A6V8LTU3_9BACT|nr:flagellar basal-body MS-ring/collar protein FliF [Fundidesulfovibrio magnetotacticus]GFK93748.1 Flagellar M-ring protein [Fundidesulfovibrio magnetotacticus]
MSTVIKSLWDQATRFWSARTMAQRILFAGVAVSVVAAFALMIFWFNQPDYKVLFSKLGQDDANRVVETLKANKIPFRLEDAGQTVLVPVDQVSETRLRIAGEGKLRGAGLGYEIFDETKVGQTDFVQRINYQRALQGELSRTISEFPQIEKARVHLVLPQKSLFIEEQRKPSASVVLTLKNGGKLEPKQVQGIVNFVAMSVEGLEPSRVTITDTSGKIVYQAKDDQSIDGLTSSQFDFRNNYQLNMERRIEELLTPIVGGGKSIAKVSASLDFAQREIKRQSFDPNRTVVRSETREESSTNQKANVDGSVPETNFRGDGFTGTQNKVDQASEKRVTNYEIDSETQFVKPATGELQRLSVAVIVDYIQDPNSKEPKFIPRPAEELERIKQAVSSAVGLDAKRGDTIEVSCMSFGERELIGEPSLTQNMLEYAQRLGKPFLNGLLVFLFLLLVVRPVVMALIRPKVTREEIEQMSRLPEAERRIALAEAEEEETELVEISKRLENAKVLAQQLFETNSDQAIQILRGWLKQEAA